MISKLFAFIFISLATLALYSCSRSKPLENKQQWSLAFNNGGCLDVCKAYSILIKSSGEYDYRGKFNVKYKGKKRGHVNDKNLTELQSLVNGMKWKDLSNSYDSDSPRKEMKYTSESINKKIVYSRLEPQELRTLENFINILIDQDDF